MATTKQDDQVKTAPRRALVLGAPAVADATKASKKADVVEQAEKVLVNVPKAFILHDDSGVPHKYAAGTYRMLTEHATHWYSESHGVTQTQD